eukprot:581346-Pyramimonas_sp.AAC.1
MPSGRDPGPRAGKIAIPESYAPTAWKGQARPGGRAWMGASEGPLREYLVELFGIDEPEEFRRGVETVGAPRPSEQCGDLASRHACRELHEGPGGNLVDDLPPAPSLRARSGKRFENALRDTRRGQASLAVSSCAGSRNYLKGHPAAPAFDITALAWP